MKRLGTVVVLILALAAALAQSAVPVRWPAAPAHLGSGVYAGLLCHSEDSDEAPLPAPVPGPDHCSLCPLCAASDASAPLLAPAPIAPAPATMWFAAPFPLPNATPLLVRWIPVPYPTGPPALA